LVINDKNIVDESGVQVLCNSLSPKKTANNHHALTLNISNKQGTVEIHIYRKPTATDITLNNTSCHPGEHKMAIFKNWINRLQKLPINIENKNKHLNTITT
jgi:hypothetical protein